MALWNVPYLIRTPLRMAGFRIGGEGGFGFSLQRCRQNWDASGKFLKGANSFHPSSYRSSTFKKLLIIIIFIVIIIATTTTIIITIIHGRNQTKFHMV